MPLHIPQWSSGLEAAVAAIATLCLRGSSWRCENSRSVAPTVESEAEMKGWGGNAACGITGPGRLRK